MKSLVLFLLEEKEKNQENKDILKQLDSDDKVKENIEKQEKEKEEDDVKKD